MDYGSIDINYPYAVVLYKRIYRRIDLVQVNEYLERLERSAGIKCLLIAIHERWAVDYPPINHMEIQSIIQVLLTVCYTAILSGDKQYRGELGNIGCL